MNRVLFISLSRLITALRKGEVTVKDFDNGLFFFGCTREHIMSRISFKEEYSKAKLNYEYSHLTMYEWFCYDNFIYKYTLQYALHLRKAILKAENDGRIYWRKKEESTDWNKLIELVAKFETDVNPSFEGEHCPYTNVRYFLSRYIKVIG